MDCVYLSDVPATGDAVLTGSGAGSMAVTQGAYGSRGNLELAAPHPAGGSTVWWFNSDSPTGPVIEPAIPAATWSTGLRVPTGTGTALAIAQMRSGPLFLEILASGPHGLQRWTWAPESGFTRTGTWPGGAGLPYLVETSEELVLGRAESDTDSHRVRRHRAPLAGYPAVAPLREEAVELSGEPGAVAADTDGCVLVAVRSEGELLLTRWQSDGTLTTESTGVAPDATVALVTDPEVMLVADAAEVDALACAWSVMDETLTLEIAIRSGERITHRRRRAH